MLEFLFIIAGTLLGALTGIIPSLHPNSLLPIFKNSFPDPLVCSILLLSLASANAIFQFLPAIFLCIPDETTVLSVLPGHRLLLKGKGFFALIACAGSALIAVFLSLLLLPPFIPLSQLAYSAIKGHLAYILLPASAYLLITEFSPRKIAFASLIFLLSGFLGFLILTFPVVNDPLFASFSGLFAISGVMLSMKAGKIPKQKTSGTVRFGYFLPTILTGVMLGAFAELLPGMSSPAQIAVFSSAFIPFTSIKFLSLTSSISASHTIFSFGGIYSIGKGRTGIAATIKDIMGDINMEQVAILASASLVAFGISTFILIFFAKKLAALISSINTKLLNTALLIFITTLVFATSGFTGLLVTATATSIGLMPPLLGIRRTHCMGLILVPAILYSLGAVA